MNERRDKKRLIEIGLRLRELRESAGLSQNELANRCDVDKNKLSLIENGKKDYTIPTLLELARGLGKHPKKLLDGEFEFLKEWE